jgi:hypothetical protein
VLELLVLRVAHDGGGLAVLLDGQALGVPADRLGLLDQRGAHAREGADVLGQLAWWLVVLLGGHGTEH